MSDRRLTPWQSVRAGLWAATLLVILVLGWMVKAYGQLPAIQPGVYSQLVGLGMVSGVENFRVTGVSDTISSTEPSLLEPQSRASYPWRQDALPVRIKAGGDAADTATGLGAQTVLVWCLLDGFLRNEGPGGKLVPITLTTAGISASAPSAESCIRVNRAQVGTGGDYFASTASNVGAIVVEYTDDVEARRIEAGVGIDQLLVFSTGAGESGVFAANFIDVNSKNECSLHSYARIGANDVTGPSYGAIVRIGEKNGLAGAIISEHPVDGKLSIGPFTDLWLLVECDVMNASASVTLVIQRVKI